MINIPVSKARKGDRLRWTSPSFRGATHGYGRLVTKNKSTFTVFDEKTPRAKTIRIDKVLVHTAHRELIPQ